MKPGGVLIVILGALLVSQVLLGDALDRLGILRASG